MRTVMMVAALAVLAGCGASGSSTGDQLRNAAEQSDPAAAPVLENAAEQADANGSDGNAAGGAAQDALDQAGQAQVAGNTSSSEGAKPHAAGDSVPPPQVNSTSQK